jgi:hypothetical protein
MAFGTPNAVRLQLRIQPIDATHWLKRSAGVSKFSVFLGRSNSGEGCCVVKLMLRNAGSRIRSNLVDDLANSGNHHFRLKVLNIVAGTLHHFVNTIG